MAGFMPEDIDAKLADVTSRLLAAKAKANAFARDNGEADLPYPEID